MTDNIDYRHFPTKYWHALDNGRVQCDLCPHACKLLEGQHGLCLGRARYKDKIVLTTYGRSSGFCIDPIEKKPLNHFLPGTPSLSFGTAGCNLSCKFCQNWSISKASTIEILRDTVMPEKIASAAEQFKCKSVAFTYNEPIIFMEYGIDVALECHKRDIKTIAVTNGYICPQPAKEFFQYIDATNVDLKGFTDEFYQKITGAHIKPILDTLIYLKHETKVWLEITCLLIPGENDSEAEITRSTKWIAEELGVDVPIHFSAFLPAWKILDTPPTSKETLVKARYIAMKNGIRYVYIGNIYDNEGSSTYCHNCGKCVIARSLYEIKDYQLTDSGDCKFCGTKCAGVFKGQAENFGQRHQPVFVDL